MSGMSWPDKLLDGAAVEWKTLGEVAQLVRGHGLQKKDFSETGVPAIHYGQIYTYYGLSTKETKSFVPPELAKQLRKVDKGDVVITNTSENIEDVGKALVYLGERQAVTGGHATIVKPGTCLLGKYFAYFSQTDTFASQKRRYAKGTKVIDVSATDMAKIQIPIPCPDNPRKSLAIQGEIVRILDAFVALTAELTAELTVRRKQYKNYRDQLLHFDEAAVEWRPLGQLAEIYGGLTGKTKSDFKDGNAKYVAYKNIFANIAVDFGTLARVKVSDGEKQNEVRYGDVLFTASSETAEEVGMSSAVTTHLEERIYLNSFSFGVRFNNDVSMTPEFTKHLFRSSVMRAEISKTASGVTRFNISKERFRKIPVPIPSLAEQARITAILDKFDALTNPISEGLPHEIELRQKQYVHYRDLLLNFPKSEEVVG